MGSFLSNLQDSLNSGNFNSEIANKMNAVNEAADEKLKELGVDGLIKNIVEKVDNEEIHELTQEDIDAAKKINDEFNEKNLKFDLMNKRIAEILEMEHLIDDSINDVFTHIEEIREIYANDENFKPLISVIDKVKFKYENVNISEISTILDIPQLDINGNILA